MLIRIFRKLAGIKPPDPNLVHITNGNLSIGKNCKLVNLHVGILHHEKKCHNIIIGEDCNIQGNITVYSTKAKVIIGDRVFIGPNTSIICYDEVSIDDDVMISWDCTIMDTNAHSLKSAERADDVLDWNKGVEFKNWKNVASKKIHIREKSWIAFKSIILKGVIVGKGAIVASGSVVTKNVDDFSIVGGNPAVFIRKTE